MRSYRGPSGGGCSAAELLLIGLLGSPHARSPGPTPMSVPVHYAALTNSSCRRSLSFWSVLSL
jgi:hypothetical protein